MACGAKGPSGGWPDCSAHAARAQPQGRRIWAPIVRRPVPLNARAAPFAAHCASIASTSCDTIARVSDQAMVRVMHGKAMVPNTEASSVSAASREDSGEARQRGEEGIDRLS